MRPPDPYDVEFPDSIAYLKTMRPELHKFSDRVLEVLWSAYSEESCAGFLNTDGYDRESLKYFVAFIGETP